MKRLRERLLSRSALALALTGGLAGHGLAERPTVTTITVNPTTTEYTQVLDFDVQADPDRVYLSSSAPLAPTAYNAALKANANATVGESQVMPLMVLDEPIGRAAQGSDTKNAVSFANWQYIDRMVVWGGTSARNVTAPGQAWIDAAHRNGVKIYGNIFLAPRTFGGRVSHVEYITQTDNQGNYIVADRLIEMAETQGFDGWFLNEEVHLSAATSDSQPGDPADDPAALAEEMGKLMDYVQANSDIEIVWYDAMTESGSVGWQGQLNSQNDRFFQNDGEVVSDAVFLDFRNLSSNSLNNSSNNAQALGRNPYDLYKGVTLETSGIVEGDGALNFIFDAGAPVSTSLFRPDKEAWDAYRDSGWNIQNYIRAEEQLYVGEAGDPSDTSQTVVSWDETLDSFTENSSWNGYAHHIAAKTPLTRDRFVSNFNYGVGTDYYVDGENLSTRDWNNLGAQDVLPTWRWMVETTDATPVEVSFDFNDAYIGGSSLKIEGSLDDQTDIPLYLASMDVHADSKLALTYKLGDVGASNLQAYISLEGDELTRIPLDIGSALSAGWNDVELDLSAYAGETIASLGLRLLDANDADYEVSIGQIGVIRGDRDIVAPATNLEFDEITIGNDTATDIRLEWDHSTDYSKDFATTNVYYYNVYQELDDDSRLFLGVTGGEGLYIDQLNRDGLESASTIVVEAISLEFGVSTAATINVVWVYDPDLNGDGVLDQADINLFIDGWRSDTTGLSDEEKLAFGDLNLDGVTDFEDWFLLREGFELAGITINDAFQVVPEPATVLLAGVLGIAGATRRRRF